MTNSEAKDFGPLDGGRPGVPASRWTITPPGWPRRGKRLCWRDARRSHLRERRLRDMCSPPTGHMKMDLSAAHAPWSQPLAAASSARSSARDRQARSQPPHSDHSGTRRHGRAARGGSARRQTCAVGAHGQRAFDAQQGQRHRAVEDPVDVRRQWFQRVGAMPQEPNSRRAQAGQGDQWPARQHPSVLIDSPVHDP